MGVAKEKKKKEKESSQKLALEARKQMRIREVQGFRGKKVARATSTSEVGRTTGKLGVG